MWLHHRDDLSIGGLARRSEHRRDLDRMMAIVVDDCDAVPLAGPGETPLDAAEYRDRLADCLVGEVEPPVLGLLNIRNFVRRIGLAIAERDGESRTAAEGSEIDEPCIGLRI